MKFKLETLGGLSNTHGNNHRILANLKGDDDSTHGVWLELPHGHAENMTLKQLEELAIRKARENFSQC
ncbi:MULTISPECIES: hypothetical protein [Leclercia]|uniref:hypothetical protein n=1 Tax=Leclercia TaxID=83654 RepID=UPI0028A64FE1|nr:MULTISPECIES: hypothetical protein [Leclercia]MEB6380045.1 hypothetical protein [Leclercia adecarboxylata]